MPDYAKILTLNYPGSQWSLNGDFYAGLVWYSDTPKPTEEELDALWIPTQDAEAKASCSKTAKQLLSDSDWAVLPDVGLKNSADFVTYRGILRGYAINPVVDPVWPTEPTPVWE